MGEMIVTDSGTVIEHDPQHAYDCDRCKRYWCCGYLCACAYDKPGLPPAPEYLIKIINTHRLIHHMDLYNPPTPFERAYRTGIQDAMKYGHGTVEIECSDLQ